MVGAWCVFWRALCGGVWLYLDSLDGVGISAYLLFQCLRGHRTLLWRGRSPRGNCQAVFPWLLLRKNPHFDEYLDGIVYAVCIGLGFAAIENVGYVLDAGEAWMATAVMRALLAVPAHFFFAVLMGYYYSLAHFGHNRSRNLFLMWAAPVLAHGIYDAIAMSQEVSAGMEVAFGVAILLFCNELRKLCTRHIRELTQADQDHYQKNPNA